MKYQLVGPPIPPKPLLSYVLYLFPFLLLFRPLRTLIALWGLKNCSQVDFEPGFRYYYGNNIHAENVFLGNTFIEDYAQIDIGAGTAFSKDNKLITGTHDLYDRRKIIAKPIKIGSLDHHQLHNLTRRQDRRQLSYWCRQCSFEGHPC